MRLSHVSILKHRNTRATGKYRTCTIAHCTAHVEPGDGSSSSSIGVIVGAVLGVGVLVAVVVLAKRRKGKRSASKYGSSDLEDAPWKVSSCTTTAPSSETMWVRSRSSQHSSHRPRTAL